MITLYSGTPGSGKSLHLARDLYDKIKYNNMLIVGNFELNLSNIKGKKKGLYVSCDNSRLTPYRLIKLSKHYTAHYYKHRKIKEGRFLLVMDECQLMFNSREWQKGNRNEWLSFFTQHRKLGYDVILIAQFDRMIDRQIRSLIEYEYIHRKVNNYGKMGFILACVCGGNMFIYIKMWYPLKERLESHFLVGKKKYYNIYDTSDMFDTD